jgi:hypothetical protein
MPRFFSLTSVWRLHLRLRMVLFSWDFRGSQRTEPVSQAGQESGKEQWQCPGGSILSAGFSAKFVSFTRMNLGWSRLLNVARTAIFWAKIAAFCIVIEPQQLPKIFRFRFFSRILPSRLHHRCAPEHGIFGRPTAVMKRGPRGPFQRSPQAADPPIRRMRPLIWQDGFEGAGQLSMITPAKMDQNGWHSLIIVWSC